MSRTTSEGNEVRAARSTTSSSPLRRACRIAGLAASVATLASVGAYTVHASASNAEAPAVPGHQRAPSAFSGYEIMTKNVNVGAGGFVRDSAMCIYGKKILGGGASVIHEGSADFKTTIRESTPGTMNGGAQSLWMVAVANNDTRPHTIQISAICATVS